MAAVSNRAQPSSAAVARARFAECGSGYRCEMARVVVVATSPVDQDALADHVDADDELFVVVPAVEQSRLQWLTNDEDDARSEAEAVGESIATDAASPETTVEVKSEGSEPGTARCRRRARPRSRPR